MRWACDACGQATQSRGKTIPYGWMVTRNIDKPTVTTCYLCLPERPGARKIGASEHKPRVARVIGSRVGKQVLKALEQMDGPQTAPEIAKFMYEDVGRVRTEIHRMAQRGDLVQVGAQVNGRGTPAKLWMLPYE